jgi:homoserine kinase
MKEKNSKVSVFAPATVANVGCGYDVLGFALHDPGDKVTMSLNNSGKVTLDKIDGDNGLLPRDPAKNIVSAVVIYFLKKLGKKQGVSVELYKQMPFGRGLGSSSASAVAGLVAINHLMGNPYSREELLPLAMEGERLACGNAHADNVAPALLGGLVLIRSYNPLDVIQLPYPEDLYCAILYPNIEIPTLQARKIIKSNVPMTDAIKQWGNIGSLVAGFCLKDYDIIARSLEDFIIEPIRAMLIPGFYNLREVATEAGALGFGISGSGPSVFSFCRSEDQANLILDALKGQLMMDEITSLGFAGKINLEGAKIIE